MVARAICGSFWPPVHLPGAVNLPLKVLHAGSAAQLDPTQRTVAYRWDGL